MPILPRLPHSPFAMNSARNLSVQALYWAITPKVTNACKLIVSVFLVALVLSGCSLISQNTPVTTHGDGQIQRPTFDGFTRLKPLFGTFKRTRVFSNGHQGLENEQIQDLVAIDDLNNPVNQLQPAAVPQVEISPDFANVDQSIQAPQQHNQSDLIKEIADRHFFGQTAVQPPAAIQVPSLNARPEEILAITAANEATKQRSFEADPQNPSLASRIAAIAENWQPTPDVSTAGSTGSLIQDNTSGQTWVLDPQGSSLNNDPNLISSEILLPPEYASLNQQASLQDGLTPSLGISDLNKIPAQQASQSFETGTVEDGPLHPVSAVKAALAQQLNSANPSLKSLYRQRGNKPLWYDQTGWTAKARDAQRSLLNAEHDGLPTRRYAVAGDFSNLRSGSPDQIAADDLMLSQATQMFLSDLTYGMDTRKASASVRQSKGAARVKKALSSFDWSSYVASLRPKNQQYQGLHKALVRNAYGSGQMRTIMINMERFRKTKDPHEAKYIHVNLPTQTLAAVNNGRSELNMPVVVGQLSRQTPVMKDRIVNLKFSPDWTVPQSIATKDIIPILAKKGSTLTKSMNLDIFRGNKKVDPDKINWHKAQASAFRFRQKPGPKNALGGVRFSLTNPRGIYLHDTPSRDLFAADTRTVSSGCVRVGDAEGLSKWLLKTNKSWGQSKIRSAMTSGKTKTVTLKRPVPVYFTYNTVNVDMDGNVEFGSDIYGLDDALAMMMGI